MALKLTGNRYVFFKSMSNSKNPEVVAAYKNAQAQLSEVKEVLSHMESNYTNETNEELFKIRSYIDFVKKMAVVEGDAAMNFFTQQIALLKQNNEQELASELESYITEKSSKDPRNFILGINKLFQEATVFEENVINGLTRIQSISENMKQLSDSAQSDIAKSFEEDYSSYRQKLLESFKTIPANKLNTGYKDIEMFNKMLANGVNGVIRELSTKNSNFLDSLYIAFNNSSSLQINQSQFKTIVINTIVQQILTIRATEFTSQLTETIKNILKDVASDIDKQNEALSQDYIKVFTNTGIKLTSIEEAAFDKNKSLANIIKDLDDDSIKKLKKKYKKTANLIDELLALNTDENYGKRELMTAKSKLTEQLRTIIKERAKKQLGNKINNMKTADIQNAIKNLNNFITPVALSDKLSTQLGQCSISGDAIAEAIVSQEAMSKIKGVLLSNTPGKQIQLKADIQFAVGPVSINTKFIDSDMAQDIISDTITRYYTQFLQDYSKIGHGSTDINAAIIAYKNQLLDMKNNIDRYVTSHNLPDESRKELYEKMYDTFSTSVSVKDYELYNNQLGVHGGNLGPGKLAEGVIKNIDKLYELGGITRIDAEKILFAALNCGSAMIGSDVKQHIETYLLGGAALMMFDDAFANTEEFLKGIQQEFDGFKGQQTVHFYRVQNLYAPASFILNEIADNLEQMYMDLENGVNFSNITMNNRVTITNNITEADMPKHGTLEERFNQMSEIAQSKVSISFSFMGGLLDIFENFENTFK